MDTIHPNHQKVIEVLKLNPEPLIQWAAAELVSLGAKLEWSMDDNFTCTESLVELGSRYEGLPSAGNQDEEALRFYAEAADFYGWSNDLHELPPDLPSSPEDLSFDNGLPVLRAEGE